MEISRSENNSMPQLFGCCYSSEYAEVCFRGAKRTELAELWTSYGLVY